MIIEHFFLDLRDTTGIRLYATQNYRPTELGILHLGATEKWVSQIIPQGAKRFNTDYYCHKECLNVNLINN